MPDAEKLILTDDIAAAVNGAFDNGTPVVFSYVDDDEQPHLSLRGTTQVFSPDQLAIWVHEPTGGLLANLDRHSRVTLLYRDPAKRTTLIFSGQAHLDHDEETRRTIYANSPERERAKNTEDKGQAMIIDLNTVQGNFEGTPVLMKRS